MPRMDNILEAVYKKKFISKCIQKCDDILSRLLRWYIASSKRIIPNKIIFMNFQNSFVCNEKYIVLELIRQKLPLDIVCVVKNPELQQSDFPEKVRLVKRGSYQFFKECVTSKVWIDNAINFFYEGMPKRKGQILINTWHGSMGLKRIGKDDNKDLKWVQKASRCDTDTDYLISNSKFETQVYQSTYWPNCKILELGHPRNDLFFIKDEKVRELIKKRVVEKLGLPLDKKIVFYAPTFRDSKTLSCYDINFETMLKALHKRFGGEWVLLLRYHFKLLKLASMFGGGEDKDIVNVSDYDDIQELMFIADVGITDYSSWICDYILTGRPSFIYASDLESYEEERGFYYPLEETPCPIAKNNEELIQCIEKFDERLYEKKLKNFLSRRGCLEFGNASVKTVEKIKEIMNII